MADWQCETCGARFDMQCDPILLEGVTRCSTCVELEITQRALAVTKRALELACLFVTVADHGDTKNYNEWLAYFTRQAEQG